MGNSMEFVFKRFSDLTTEQYFQFEKYCKENYMNIF